MKDKNGTGEGHQAKLAIVADCTTEIDGKKQVYKIDWEVKFTMENVDYAVRLVAGCIAQVADNISRDGLSKRKAVTA